MRRYNQRLFRMDTDLDTLEKVQACVVPRPSTFVPGYPPELEACVMKALSKNKQDRYQTARELQLDLEAFAREAKLRATPSALGGIVNPSHKPRAGWV